MISLGHVELHCPLKQGHGGPLLLAHLGLGPGPGLDLGSYSWSWSRTYSFLGLGLLGQLRLLVLSVGVLYFITLVTLCLLHTMTSFPPLLPP